MSLKLKFAEWVIKEPLDAGEYLAMSMVWNTPPILFWSKNQVVFCESFAKLALILFYPKKLGDPRTSISEHWQPLESIEFVVSEKTDFSKEFVEKYQNGFSVGEIAAEYGCSKHKILIALKRHHVSMRPKVAFKTTEARRYGGKSASKPYYGFCYFEGKLTKHPNEFPVLQLIHRMWQHGKSAHYINLELDKRRFKSREGCQWSWAAIQNIIKRFEEKKIVLHKGGRYELG